MRRKKLWRFVGLFKTILIFSIDPGEPFSRPVSLQQPLDHVGLP